jgi:hypothetical protein
MTATAVIVVDGVLRDSRGRQVLDTGKRLYAGLSSAMNIALLAEDYTEDQLTHFLNIEGFKRPPYMLTRQPWAGTPAQLRIHQLHRLRRFGCDVEFVIEPDTKIAAEVIAAGYAVLHYARPVYGRDDHRPDYRPEIKPWDLLAAELERQRELKAADPRIGAET